MAKTSGIDMLLKFAKTLERHFEAILPYFDFDGLSTGPLEGTNNKIKTMQRKAIWLQRNGVLQTEDNGNSRDKVRFSRMNLKKYRVHATEDPYHIMQWRQRSRES